MDDLRVAYCTLYAAHLIPLDCTRYVLSGQDPGFICNVTELAGTRFLAFALCHSLISSTPFRGAAACLARLEVAKTQPIRRARKNPVYLSSLSLPVACFLGWKTCII